MSENQIISFLKFVNQDDEDKYNMLVESAAVIRQKENIIKDIKAQLEYLETYSSKEDVFEDMKRRLDKIEKIIDKENK